jgi:glutathione S-transferase
MVNVEVHGNPKAADTHQVLILLEELSLKYDLVTEDPETSPFGGVVVKYGDRVLFGENAIMRYISQNNKDLGDFLIDIETEMWLEVGMTHFREIASRLCESLSERREEQEHVETQFHSLLEKYENRLSECNYIGGDSFTIADISHIPLLESLLRKGYKEKFRPYKNVYRWLKRVLKRESVEVITK